MSKTRIVLGLGWGDESKGLTTDFLTNHDFYPYIPSCCFDERKQSLVIRFSGGHQAGHTVVKNGVRHVFSTFGAGTLSGHPTYWSKYCTFLPETVLKEYKALIQKGVTPTLYVDALAPVTTFYDFMLNQFKEKSKGNQRHGSCGVGFGTTVKRTKTPYTFFVQDLVNPEIAKRKLESIEKYYLNEINNIVSENPSIPQSLIDNHTTKLDFKKATEIFIEKLKEVLSIIKIVTEKKFFRENKFEAYVFEGSQGILLDQNFGLFYPHVTMADTTSKNALEIINRNGLDEPEIFYITRCYQTRHGNGWMSNESLPIKLKNNEKETNVFNEYQEGFRTGVLDVDLINHSICVDENFSYGLTKNIVFSCLDQVDDKDKIPYTVKGQLKHGNVNMIIEHINQNFSKILTSESDISNEIKVEFNLEKIIA
jgi:adenylosuccinate synthase